MLIAFECVVLVGGFGHFVYTKYYANTLGESVSRINKIIL